MPVDLTREEMNLISSLFNQSSFTMNRESMAAYLRMTDNILRKFEATNSVNSTQGESA